MVRINNFGTLMDGIRRFPSILAGIFLQFYSGKSVGILDLQWKNLFKIDKNDYDKTSARKCR